MHKVFGFPDTVNEVSARLVAAGVVMLTLLYLASGSGWVLGPLVFGFVARVVSGPTLSPLGQFVTRLVTPRLGLAERLVPGPPKRFAQGIGAVLSSLALIAHLAGWLGAAQLLVSAIVIAASLESALGYCLGCAIFGRLMAAGVLPESVCLDCAEIGRRLLISSRPSDVEVA